jgi:glycosidase
VSIAWFRNAVIYQILIDRFAGCRADGWDKPQFLGGTIRGIIGKLDYIKDLGANTIWISPFYKTDQYHGYHVTDFYQVEPRFGNVEDLKELIESVHKAGMRIIADFVPNHVSDQHPYFLDARKRVDSPYYDWFYFNNWPDDYLCFLSVRSLPKLNLDNLLTRKHIINAAKFWLSLGFDGYRLDHCIGPTHKFWKLFRTEIKNQFPNCILIGEACLMGIKCRELKTISIKHKFLRLFNLGTLDGMFQEYIGELDGVLDFEFLHVICDFAVRKITKELALKRLHKHYKKFPPDYYLPTFLDNHDMDRILFHCGNDIELFKEAAQIQFAIDQPKIIYYGTESGLTQDKSTFDTPFHGDLQARRPMNWDSVNKEVLDFYRKLIQGKSW